MRPRCEERDRQPNQGADVRELRFRELACQPEGVWRHRAPPRSMRLGLESGNIGECQFAAMHMYASEFGAAVQGRKDLAGIEQALGVESAFQPLLLVEIDFSEHFPHQVTLLDTDAVLTCQHAAKLHAAAKDIGAKGFGPLHLAGLVSVIEDERMQIAVAGMEDVRDAQTI